MACRLAGLSSRDHCSKPEASGPDYTLHREEPHIVEDVTASDRETFLSRVIRPQLSVNSGVYSVIDRSLRPTMNRLGEYEYEGLDLSYDGPAARLLQVSAFAGVGLPEDQIARQLYGSHPSSAHHPVAGYHLGAFAGWSLDADLRANASSGGLTTWLLLELFRLGRIDGVVHLAPATEGGSLFSYRISRTPDEIRGGMKSRYYPGELSSSLREILTVPGRYAVVGIPSFIYEVRLLQNLDPMFRDRIQYTLGLICGHQKTANYASALAWRAGFEPGTLTSIDFRKKVSGEPANAYSTEFTGIVDGRLTTRRRSQSELFGTDWGWGFFKSNFSDFTQDALNETSDVVLGDAWLPQYVRDSSGTNVVLTRSAEMHELLREGQRRGDVHLDPIFVEDVVRSQASLVRQSVLELPYRYSFLQKRGAYVPGLRREEGKRLGAARRQLQRARLEMSRKSHTAFEKALEVRDLGEFDRAMGPLVERYVRVQKRARIEAKLAEGPSAVFQALRWRFG